MLIKQKNQMNFSKLSTHLVLLCFPFVIINKHYIIKKKKSGMDQLCGHNDGGLGKKPQLKNKGQFFF